LIRAIVVAAFLFATSAAVPTAEALKVPIGYLGRAEKIETISLIDQPAANDGIAGAQLAVQDNNTTGKFLNQSFSVEANADQDRRAPAPPAPRSTNLAASGMRHRNKTGY
jgi:hypothetical protein